MHEAADSRRFNEEALAAAISRMIQAS